MYHIKQEYRETNFSEYLSSDYYFCILMYMKTMFCFTSHLLSPFILCHLIDCCLTVKFTEHISTGKIFSDVQHCLGYCEGEMACVLLISPEVQRPSV
jgi:hypothetical protein